MSSEQPANQFHDGSRHWIYTAKVRGKYQTLHRISGVGLKAILFVVPWLMVGGNPLLRIDLPGRKLYALGAIFGATDTIFLLLIGLFLAFSLFFITSLYGRLWCGYMCPQTVFLEEWVRRIETALEGDRGRRRARDKGPWNFDKIWRKTAKWSSFLVLSAVLSMTLVSYFAGARELWTGQSGFTSYAFVGVFTAGLFADFAWFREQFCNYLCPYARFQGAMADEHSLTVAYNVGLGEPRKKGKRKTEEDKAAFGACIECDKCVTVCPAGIDIRDGFQLECINCGRCVDACHGVMGKMEQESLITYTSVAELEGGKRKVLRPRTVAYSTLLATIALVFTGMLVNRHELDASVNRAPGPTYQVQADNAIRNTFLLKVTNHGTKDAPAVVDIEVLGLEGADIAVAGVELATGEARTVPLVITMPDAAALPRTTPITVRFTTESDVIDIDTNFKSGEAMNSPSGS